MKFALFQWIGESVDATMNTFITQTASNVILGFQLLILTGATLYITLTGYAIATGAVEQPFQTFIKQCIKISIIAAFVMTADSYTSTVISAMQSLESGLADIVSSPDAKSKNIYEVLDKSVDTGLDVAYKMLEKAVNRKLYEIGKISWDILNSIIMAIAIIIIHLPAAATIIMAKLGLGILLGIGPLFIAALMFPVTSPWFDKWFQQAMAFILEIAIVMVVASTGVGLYKELYKKLIKTGGDLPITTSVEIVILALIVLFVLKKTSGLGAQIAGGISFGAVTFRSMAEGIGNAVNPKVTRRDMQSGEMVTAGRLGHMIAGNTMWNPAYRQHVMQNLSKHWGRATGGSVTQ